MGLWAKWRARKMPPVVAVWYGVAIGMLGGYVGFALIDGTWGQHPHSAFGWAVYIGGGFALGLIGTAAALLIERRKQL